MTTAALLRRGVLLGSIGIALVSCWVEEKVPVSPTEPAPEPEQTGIEGDVTIRSQFDLDLLISRGGSSLITGNLTVSHSLLVNLRGLQGLTSVGGWVFINQNAALTSLEGLNNLASLWGLTISDNESLTGLEGLEGLTSVGRNLTIGGNTALTSLEGLNSLTTVGGLLTITRSEALTSLEGLNNLAIVGGLVTITRNEALTSLEGLDNLNRVWGLTISRNEALTTLQDLAAC